MNSVRLIPNCLFIYKWHWHRGHPPRQSTTPMLKPSMQAAPLQIPRKAPVASVLREPVETPCSKPHLPIALNGKLVDVIDCTPTLIPSIKAAPLQTPRAAPLVHEPRKAPAVGEPIALNGKFVDVIECTPTRQRSQTRQPTQNVAVQEKGKFVSHISVSFDCISDWPDGSTKASGPTINLNLNFYRYFYRYYTKKVLC